MTSILWYRQDLRLHDQPALRAAAADGAVIPLYILDDETPGDWLIGGAQRWWLHASLASLDAALRNHGSRLIIRRGAADKVLQEVLEESGAERVHALRHYEPWWRKAEDMLGDRLCLHDGNHLTRVEDVRTGSGKPFRIYSSFWKALQSFMPPEKPVAAPRKIDTPNHWPSTLKLAELDLLPTKPDWSVDFDGTPGEDEARKKAKAFTKRVDHYEAMRNLPAEEGTSMLSPHLHFGEISARELWYMVSDHDDAIKFQKELAWRDFTDGVVMALPDYAEKNGRPKYDKLKWRTGKEAAADLKAWQQGHTGYPIVDAGMRQLWASGWMHNRLRMITASFLIKHLLIDWREGERWFWDCLVDADYGNNSVNWQWVAGTGIDANMFSRIMAPLTQSEKFDAGDYIRRWVPELADVSDDAIHDPEEAGCKPNDYPSKIIGHREARERALAAAARLR
ncbi:cryptochrome/photolyase family protein [Sphingomonas sp. Mn802worker]|uniref:cryptochrome/photolyase family protein n=1 Tax=Sphingomonas sp. Mn802worker TaxID=629773 RepID=UPI000369B9DB|nr:deoxyribodipyrimidine photo-lyase [Sphingomonas sp. Mn802worker]